MGLEGSAACQVCPSFQLQCQAEITYFAPKFRLCLSVIFTFFLMQWYKLWKSYCSCSWVRKERQSNKLAQCSADCHRTFFSRECNDLEADKARKVILHTYNFPYHISYSYKWFNIVVGREERCKNGINAIILTQEGHLIFVVHLWDVHRFKVPKY